MENQHVLILEAMNLNSVIIDRETVGQALYKLFKVASSFVVSIEDIIIEKCWRSYSDVEKSLMIDKWIEEGYEFQTITLTNTELLKGLAWNRLNYKY